ncbi:MAG TPA: hypothetical protein VJS45_11205, partial [Acidimicrobiia bacterium]|nr:hypothetical protein [Acidimicrobiia bacterium]
MAKAVAARRVRRLGVLIAALVVIGACGRGGSSEQRVSSRGLKPTETSRPVPPADVTTTTGSAASPTGPATSPTTRRPTTTTTKPRPTSTTSTTAKPPTAPVCPSPVLTHYPLTATGGSPGAVTVAPDGTVWF